MEFTIGLESPFSLDYTLESGQVFRWARKGEWWYGEVSGGLLKARQEGGTLRCESSSDLLGSEFVRNYFRLDEDIEPILASIAKDKVITEAVQKFYGTRLIRQDRWECLASFVLATNANIPRIKKMISEICTRFGEQFEFDGSQYHSFPGPEKLASAPVAELRECGLGYRAPFLKRVATSVDQGGLDFGELVMRDYEESRKMLLTKLFGSKLLLGVGPKVADCVLLYSCDKDEAFPIDVWIARELSRSYPRIIPLQIRKKLTPEAKAKLTTGDYEKVSKSVRRHFGVYAGYAQLYLYMAARSSDGPGRASGGMARSPGVS
ncbi:MAG: DNA-3-methyladenine glycosylase 2 family protein [Thaumarchaeota archaeon]|nr:DNA-3-methyladenine glycosylase 2 family protein [Nitrososphaerota archaeon]